ncbi:MAG TPA: FKBP-type peptidyl-prolyl cis-trans isomerase [Ferruginibacter sp.]|nr:FKBP-type peptidyl-prolyl cis-trans isomerase [Ferruginibacter sp.]
MTKFIFAAIIVAIASTATQAQVAPKKAAPKTTTTRATTPGIVLKNANDSFSYALGMNIAHNLDKQGIEQVNYPAMQKAMEDVLKNKTTTLTEQQANMTIQEKIQKYMGEKLNTVKAKNQAFLDANGKRAGVITLPDGLQYEVVKKSDSSNVSPTIQDTVVANYAGSLIDGTEFDNSYKRGQPLTIPVGGVIKGWTEILQLMHVGDRFKVYIPSELGYGDRGAGGQIPGGSTLIFDMELLAIKAPVVVPTPTPTPAPSTAPAPKSH